MSRFRRGTCLLAVALLLLPACGGNEYEDLAARCRGGPKGLGEDGLGDVFRRLRERPDPRAFDALEAALADPGLNHFWRLQTALALSALDTPAARTVLEERVRTPDFAIGGAPELLWSRQLEVDADLRDRFLATYLLHPVPGRLALRLRVGSEVVEGVQRFHFDVEATNVSEQTFRIPIRGMYVGKMLLFRRADGRFVRTVQRCACDREGPPPPVTLTPGATHRWGLEAWTYRRRPRAGAAPWRSRHSYAHDTEVYVEIRWEPGPQGEGDVGYDVGRAGGYDVVAWIEHSGWSRSEHGEGAPLWRGRAVSNAVRVAVLPPPVEADGSVVDR